MPHQVFNCKLAFVWVTCSVKFYFDMWKLVYRLSADLSTLAKILIIRIKLTEFLKFPNS